MPDEKTAKRHDHHNARTKNIDVPVDGPLRQLHQEAIQKKSLGLNQRISSEQD
jgi:hypothetical protein